MDLPAVQEGSDNTAANISNPYFESPVLSTNTPTAYGEANPPRLPSELISAMPDAAAAPARAAAGSSQNGEIAAKMPIAATQIAINARTGLDWIRNPEATIPMAPNNIANEE